MRPWFLQHASRVILELHVGGLRDMQIASCFFVHTLILIYYSLTNFLGQGLISWLPLEVQEEKSVISKQEAILRYPWGLHRMSHKGMMANCFTCYSFFSVVYVSKIRKEDKHMRSKRHSFLCEQRCWPRFTQCNQLRSFIPSSTLSYISGNMCQ